VNHGCAEISPSFSRVCEQHIQCSSRHWIACLVHVTDGPLVADGSGVEGCALRDLAQAPSACLTLACSQHGAVTGTQCIAISGSELCNTIGSAFAAPPQCSPSLAPSASPSQAPSAWPSACSQHDADAGTQRRSPSQALCTMLSAPAPQGHHNDMLRNALRVLRARVPPRVPGGTQHAAAAMWLRSPCTPSASPFSTVRRPAPVTSIGRVGVARGAHRAYDVGVMRGVSLASRRVGLGSHGGGGSTGEHRKPFRN